jgi:uncharacterized membrane protein YjjP (DUF1212 family)
LTAGDPRVATLADIAAGLHGDGAETSRTLERLGQAAGALGVRVAADLGWTRSQVEVTDGDAVADRTVRIAPATVGMNRVRALDLAIQSFAAGRTSLDRFRSDVAAARALPAANVLLFAAACAVGACGLALIQGAHNWQTYAIIAVASIAGAFVRRGIGRLGGSNFSQVFFASVIAGLGGALSLQLGVGSDLRLAALCPCMILVPGPHLLNGALDLAALRLPLGMSRLAFATITLVVTGVGVLVGLGLCGVGLDADPIARDVPLWVDAPTAGIVAVCYGVFYSAPLRILAWPLVVGAGAHALHWLASAAGASAPLSAGIAALVAGAVLLPVSRRFTIPFSAIGFASVVSMMPGALVFRALGALTQLPAAHGDRAVALLGVVATDAATAVLVVTAMAIGFLLPTALYRWIGTVRDRRRMAIA